MDTPPCEASARQYDAVLFDLLTALLDSWTVWADVAGDPAVGRRWRDEYLKITYGEGAYRPYETLVAEAAEAQGLDRSYADRLSARWNTIQPWDEAPGVLRELSSNGLKIGVVTNCSEKLGKIAADQLRVPLDVMVTAEVAGAYKPRPEPYALAIERLALPADRILFVAGSRYDIPGAGGLGMPVWWHNRINMDRGDLPAPLAEHDSLAPLLRDTVGPISCGP
ncbi:HAD-IA family hydrolase [Mycolicibacterium baixiangningiae]|uniref:HAD-IA family hydrolase n=1 Tax=Mycolicibacterium baixiangningiae TaxID=2761578 RepID=UPI0018E5C7A8|nr:HAD-IA family hydrolase [Mycolicibacterium baixiangningiae]